MPGNADGLWLHLAYSFILIGLLAALRVWDTLLQQFGRRDPV